MAVALDNLITYWERLDGGQKEGVIEYIKYILEEKHSICIDEYNRELELGLAEIERGEYLTHEEVVEEAKNW